MKYLSFLFPKSRVRAQLVARARDKVIEQARGLQGGHEFQLKRELAGLVAAEIESHASEVIPPSLEAFSDQLIERATKDMCKQLWSRVELSKPS